jgi:hypothetical protein
MTALPIIARLVLTFLVAALSSLIAIVDDETIRVVCAPIVAGLAAIGIVPPQVPTRTVVARRDDEVVVRRGERGYTIIELLIALCIVVFVCVFLLKLLDHV